MPTITTQRPVAAAGEVPLVNGATAVSGITSARALKRAWMKVLLYGRSRVGKSTLSAQWPKPLLAIACEPRENGGADSLIGMDGVDVSVVQLKPGPNEPDSGSEKALRLAAWLQQTYADTGKCPYQSVTLDVTALQDIILAEIMGWDSPDSTIKRPRRGEGGGVGRPQFGQRAERCIKVFRAFKDLPCHVVFVGQEKDHNPEKDEDGNAVGSKLLVPAQERRFMAVSLGQASVEWLQNACQYVCQLYMDAETQTIETPVTVGEVTTIDKITVPTGRFVRRLRTSYSPNYAAGITVPGISSPEYIEATTPRAMYEALMRVSAGERVKEGHYSR